MAEVQLPFPFLGIIEATAFYDQPEQSTAFARNVRGFDPITGRNRGGQRAGTKRFISAVVNGAAKPVQHIASVTKHDGRTTYATTVDDEKDLAFADIEWQKALIDPADPAAYDMVSDRFGNVYVSVGADGLITKYGPDGGKSWDYTVGMPDSNNLVKCLEIDFEMSLFVGISQDSDGSGTAGVVEKYKQVEGTNLDRSWVVDMPNGGGCRALAVFGNSLYVAEQVGAGDWYLHHYINIYTSTPFLLWSAAIAHESTTYNLTSLAVGPSGDVYAAEIVNIGGTPYGQLRRYLPNGEVGDIYGDDTNESAVGFGVAVDKDGGIYSCGPAKGTGVAGIRKLTLSGGNLSSSWIYSASPCAADVALQEFQGPHNITVDRDKRVYVGLAVVDDANTNAVYILTTAGALVAKMAESIVDSVFAIVVDPIYPVGKDDPTHGTAGPEFVFLATNEDASFGLHKVRLLSRTVSDDNPRSLVTIAVADGAIKLANTDAASWDTPAGGTVALSKTNRHVRSVSAFNSIYMLDGAQYVKYDALTDTATVFKAEFGGIPAGCKLLCIWNGRWVIARSDDDAQNWYMSAIGNFGDFEFFPYPASAAQAVAGNNTPAGRTPDIINALMPWSDDLLFFGCDHSIWRLTGDPASSGRMDLVSDITGVAFGDAWCKDEQGTIYFFGSKGGVYAMPPGGIPTLISQQIDDRLKDLADDESSPNKLSLEDYDIKMVWNQREQGVHVYLCKHASIPTVTLVHYYWDRRNGAWWFDNFGIVSASHDLEPLSLHVVDGDAAADRAILLGAWDGRVRKWDLAADSDDDGNSDIAIGSEVYIGPFGRHDSVEGKLTKLMGTLGISSANVSVSVYGQESPDFGEITIGSPQDTGTLVAGRNFDLNVRARGSGLSVRLYNITASQTWQLERLVATVHPAGRIRPR